MASLFPPGGPVGYQRGVSVCEDSVAYGYTAGLWEYQVACANDVLGEHHTANITDETTIPAARKTRCTDLIAAKY